MHNSTNCSWTENWWEAKMFYMIEQTSFSLDRLKLNSCLSKRPFPPKLCCLLISDIILLLYGCYCACCCVTCVSETEVDKIIKSTLNVSLLPCCWDRVVLRTLTYLLPPCWDMSTYCRDSLKGPVTIKTSRRKIQLPLHSWWHLCGCFISISILFLQMFGLRTHVTWHTNRSYDKNVVYALTHIWCKTLVPSGGSTGYDTLLSYFNSI